MAWTETEISQFQIDNNKALGEINATLRPDVDLSGKVGCFINGQQGDLMTAMSVLKYRKEIFGGKQIVWFVNNPNCDLLRYAPISEVRPWPWAGNGLPIGTPDYWPMLTTNDNKLNKELKLNFKDTEDLDEGYFPAPYMVAPPKRHGIDYPNVSKRIFGVPDHYEWHPYLSYSPDEVVMMAEYMANFQGRKNIIFETFAGSGQSLLDTQMVQKAIKICRNVWGDCNFFFASHKYLRSHEQFPENFFDEDGVYSCAHFTVRQFGLMNDYCDLIISVSSGITVACSAWDRKTTPVIQFCGSWICSTKSLAYGRQFELVAADFKPIEQSKGEFEHTLLNILIANQ